MSIKPPSSETFSLQPGETSAPIAMHSDWWKIYALTAEIEASLNGSRLFFPVRVGSGLQESIGSGAWENIIFRNNSDDEINLTLLWGSGEYLSDDHVSIANPLFTLSEAQITALKSVSVVPTVYAKTEEINQILSESSATFTDCEELTVLNGALATVTANGVAVPPGTAKTWRVYHSGQKLHDITINASASGAVAHVLGVK